MNRQAVTILSVKMCRGCPLHSESVHVATDGSETRVFQCNRRDCDNHERGPVPLRGEAETPNAYRGDDD